MKQRMKKLLALLLSVSMAVAPVSVYAEDRSIPVQTELITEAVTEAITEAVTEKATEKVTEANTEGNTEGNTEAAVVTEAAAEEQTQADSETMPEVESESESESETFFAGETLPENETEGGAALLAMPKATDGVTTPVDCTTTLADGEYTPEAFKVVKASDGTTPKTAFTCKKITVKDGKAEATIEIASGAYTYMKANGQQYPGTCTDTTSTFTFPVDLNVKNDILGFTSKMNTEVAYKMLITLNETASTEAGTESESESESETETETETETEVKIPNYGDGEYEIGIESDFSMFKITSTSAQVSGGTITVTIGTSKTTYNKIYLGSVSDSEETKNANAIEGVANENGGYDFTFALPKSMMGKSVPFSPCKLKDGTWYVKKQYYLTIPEVMNKVNSDAGYADGSYTIPVESDNDAFVITSAKASVVKGKIQAVLTTGQSVYDRIYFGSVSDAKKDSFVTGTAGTDGCYNFTFTLTKDQLGANIAFVPGNAEGWYAQQCYMILPDTMEEEKELVKTQYGLVAQRQYYRVDGGYEVCFTETYPKSDYNFAPFRALYRFYYDNVDYGTDPQRFIYRTDNGDGTYCFRFFISDEYLQQNDGKFTYLVQYADGSWVVNENNEPMAHIQMNVAGFNDTKPAYGNGTYSGTVKAYLTVDNRNVLSNFNVTSSEITVAGDEVTLIIRNNCAAYDRLYIGTAQDTDKSVFVARTVNEANTDAPYEYVIKLPKSSLCSEVSFVPGNSKTGLWSARTWKLILPYQMTKTSSDPAEEIKDGDYTVGVESSATMFKVVNCVLHKKDGAYTAELVLSSTGYDSLYLGKAEDAAANESKWIKAESTVTYKDANGEEKTGTKFVLPVSALDTPIAVAAHAVKSGTWYDRTLTFKSSTLVSMGEKETESESETDTEESESASETESESETEVTVIPDDATAAVDNSTTLKDGVYTPDQFSFQGGSGKTKITCDKIRVKDGKAFAVIKFSSASYTYVKASAGKYMNLTPGEKSTFEIPVALNKDNTVIGNTTAMGEAKEITYTICPSLSKTAETETETETEIESETETETETEGGKPVDPSKLPNGNYNVDVETGAAMFKVVQAVLTKKNGAMTAVITLSGTGYDYLYMGSASDAPKKESKWIAVKDIVNYKDSNGVTKSGARYEIPVAALDQAIALAARSASKETWFDRSLLFDSRTLEKIETSETETETESETETEADTKADTESKYESDLSGGTSAVDSSTPLKDGVYTPDKFSWSGGSGRTSISCNKITVTNGRAYATIVFSSSSYEYVKANGNKYFGTKGGGTTSFVIPIQLNANNTIIGMTTAMSASHEITYSIYVYLKAADQSSKTENGDGEAPEIVGLSYESETKLEHAEYFRIFNYSDGIKLIEIDMVSDTLRDPDLEDAEAEEMQTETETDAAEEEIAAEDEEVVQTADEIAAELYLADTVKYLVVPEDVEIPVGLDKEMIIVTVPAQSAYIASEEAMTAMEELELTEWIKASGFEAEECKSESVAKAMEEEKTVFAGSYEDPQFRQLILSGCDLAIFLDEILVKEEETQEEDLERFAQITSGFGTLGIPMLVDRSADEEEPLAQAEWMLVYGVLFGCEEQAEAWYQNAVSAQE